MIVGSAFTARAAMLAVVILSVCLSVRLSVRLSVTRVLCDKTKQCTADIFISHERAITYSFVDAPFHLKFALKVTHPLRKTPTSTNFRIQP